jgi:hypothetical protein
MVMPEGKLKCRVMEHSTKGTKQISAFMFCTW